MPEPSPSPNAPETPEAPESENQAPPSRITIAAYLERLTPHAWVTPTLVGLIVLGFGWEIFKGASPISPTAEQLLAAGGNFGPNVDEGEWWRLPASLFLHAGLIHIAFNTWAFWSIGKFAERVFGNLTFLAIYLLAGIGGALASLGVHPLTVCVGASGAIFGVYGAVLAFVLLHKGLFPDAFLAQQRNSLLGFLGYNLVFSLSIPNVDLSAHGGGLVTGFLAGGLLGRDLVRPTAFVWRRAAGFVAVTLAVAVLGVRIRTRLHDVPEIRADREAHFAFVALKARDLPEAIAHYTEALSLVEEASWLTNRGLAHLWSGDAAVAVKDFQAADAKEPSARTSALLCEAEARVAKEPLEYDKAIRWCTEGIAKDPKNADLLALRASVHDDHDQLDEALADVAATLTLDPTSEIALRVRLGVHLKQKNINAADDDCVALLGRNETPGELGAPLFRMCSAVAYERGDRDAGKHRLDQALAVDPRSSDALAERALESSHEGRYAESANDYRASQSITADRASAWNNLAWDEVLLGDFAAAKKDADRAVALVANDAAYLGTRCFALAGLGEVELAKNDCVRAVELHPQGLVDRGMLAFLNRDYAAARESWLKASGDPETARELLPWIAKLPK